MSRVEHYDKLLAALDRYRETRDAWNQTVSRPGFYDPCGDTEAHMKQDIKDAVLDLDDTFAFIVRDVVGLDQPEPEQRP